MSRYAFVDPIHPDAEVVLVIDDDFPDVKHPDIPGVEHPDCTERAGVASGLDAFYCMKCHWNGRISGEWFMAMLELASS